MNLKDKKMLLHGFELHALDYYWDLTKFLKITYLGSLLIYLLQSWSFFIIDLPKCFMQ